MAMRSVLGLMSGTSLDGIDVALLSTDGEAIGEIGPTLFYPYGEAERSLLKAALADARGLADRQGRPGVLADAERMLTAAHGEAIAQWMRENPRNSMELICFHGQTV